MKKDIQIPEVTGVKFAVVLEPNEIHKTQDWNVYIINEKEVDLEMVVIVSKGFDTSRKTSVMRRKIDVLPANSFAKVELILPELFALNNQFQLSFFCQNHLFDKTFLFPKNSITESKLQLIPSLQKKGIIAS